MISKSEYSSIKHLRRKLNSAYKEKELNSIKDKRRIIKDVLNYEPTLSSMKENELEKVLNYVENNSTENLKSKVIAWAYMVELDDGLTKRKMRSLIDLMPADIEVFPFELNEPGMLTANSMAIGFIDNDFYSEYVNEVKQKLADVCNDWTNERNDNLYILNDGKQVKMLCDENTLK